MNHRNSRRAMRVGMLPAGIAIALIPAFASAQEATIAWLLGLSPVVIVIPGATRPATVDSIVRAAGIVLSDEQRALLDATEPEATSMYPDDGPRSPLPGSADG